MRGFFRLPVGRREFVGYSITNLNQYERMANEIADGKLGKYEHEYQIMPISPVEIAEIKRQWEFMDEQEKLLHRMGRPPDVEIKYICACGYLYATIRAYKAHRNQTNRYCKLHRVR